MSCVDSYDWRFKQGETAILEFIVKDSAGVVIDLSGYTARSQGRESHESTALLYDASTGIGNIVIDGPNGKVTTTISDTTTAAIAAPVFGVYDVELIDGSGVVENILSGSLIVTPEVTKS